MKYFIAVAVVLLSLLVPATFGQATDSNLVGTIVDASGADIQNASIEIQNVATGIKSTTKSGTDGTYRFNNVPIGLYNITVTASGFATSSLKGVNLELNKTATANVQMQVGTVATALEVSEAGVTIDTTTAQLGTTYEARQIVGLPIIENANGLYGALNLALLSAGVGSNGGIGYGIGPSVGGQRPVENNFTIEGVDNNNKGVTGPLVYVPQEATAEFTLMQNQVGAEFGHSTGGQFNTNIKSGTNQYHGSAYEYFQNRNLNAIDQAYQRQGFTKNPRYDQNKLGGSIGGPIKKDKLFFFGTVEYAPLGVASTVGAPIEAPTAAGLTLLNNMSGLSKNNLAMFEKYVPVAPTASDSTVVNGVNIPTGILPIAAPNYTNFTTYLGSVDYNPTDKDQIRGRFIYNRSNGLDNNANLPTFWTTLPQRYYLATVSNIHTFTPNLTNELRLAYSRFSQVYPVGNQQYSGLDVFPNITFDNDLGLQLGPDPNAPQSTVQNTYQLVDNVNWQKGKHSFKFGFDGRNSISPQFFTQRVRGDYDYTTLELFLKDQIPDDLGERSVGSTPYYGNQWATYFYATDQWRLMPNFTVNLGLRYERTTVPETMKLQTLNSVASVPGLISFNEPQPQNNAVAPRIGLAYSPGHSGNTSIRAGFGMAYDVIYDNVGLTDYPPQLVTTIDTNPVQPGIYKAPFLANGGIRTTDVASGNSLTAAQARAQTGSYIPDFKLPYSLQWNAGVQHVFHKDYTVEVRYLGTRSVHLLQQNQINYTNTPVTASRTLPTYLQKPTQAQLDALTLTLAQLQAISPIDPAFKAAGFTSKITSFIPTGNATYNSLATQVTRRFSAGLQFVGAYTWSHNIDDNTVSHFSTYLTPRRPEDFANLRSERASSALDRRQRFTMSWVYESQWMKSANGWLMRNLAGNWTFVGTYTAETGELVTAQSGIDSNLNGDTAGDRTLINPAGTANIGSGVTALKNTAGATVAYLANNPNARYIQAGLGVFPNGGRNTLQTPGINNFDLSFGKKFNITESKRIELRMDAANFFNHPQFTPGLINSVKLTTYETTRNFLEPQSPLFQGWNQIFNSNARSLQLALRFIF